MLGDGFREEDLRAEGPSCHLTAGIPALKVDSSPSMGPQPPAWLGCVCRYLQVLPHPPLLFRSSGTKVTVVHWDLCYMTCFVS